MQSDPERSTLVILVPEAEPYVGALRSRFDQSALYGLGAHITLLYPFKEPVHITGKTLSALADIFRSQPSFEFTLAGVCGFPGVVYLDPDPGEPFLTLTRALVQRFPETPPYRGEVPDPLPHLTVAHDPLASDLPTVAEKLIELPAIRCQATQVSLAFKDRSGWETVEVFDLKPPSSRRPR